MATPSSPKRTIRNTSRIQAVAYMRTSSASNVGLDKVNQVSEHVNMILRYIPYVQANFVLGLDDDFGEEPFELTKLFVDKTPGVFQPTRSSPPSDRPRH